MKKSHVLLIINRNDFGEFWTEACTPKTTFERFLFCCSARSFRAHRRMPYIPICYDRYLDYLIATITSWFTGFRRKLHHPFSSVIFPWNFPFGNQWLFTAQFKTLFPRIMSNLVWNWVTSQLLSSKHHYVTSFQSHVKPDFAFPIVATFLSIK